MSLFEVANFLKSQGVINAINLDGGGSATYLVNGSLASYPSDHWSVITQYITHRQTHTNTHACTHTKAIHICYYLLSCHY